MRAVKAIRIVLDGDLTVQGAADLKAMLLTTLSSAGEKNIEIELSGVSELDTAGLQLLLMVKRQVEHLGRTLLLVDPSAATTEVLSLAHLDLQLQQVVDAPPTRQLQPERIGGVG